MVSLVRFVRKLVPRHVLCGLSFAFIYLKLRGHSRRGELGMCIDASGEPVPWLTYPALDFLSNLDISGARVFEYGSGASTLYWQRRCAQVVSVEKESDWHREVGRLCNEKVSLNLCCEGAAYPGVIENYGAFDIVLIDGAERKRCVEKAIEHLADNGFIILDNSDWYPNSCQYLREKGFTQIDFVGLTPINAFVSVSSLFFKSPSAFRYRKDGMLKPIGGRVLNPSALDD